jgi:transcriptional regulator with XRE-family HTH domain
VRDPSERNRAMLDMARLGYTQARIAAEFGISQQRVGQIIHGKPRKPPLTTGEKLAKKRAQNRKRVQYRADGLCRDCGSRTEMRADDRSYSLCPTHLRYQASLTARLRKGP